MILYHVTLFNKPTQEILIPRIPGDTSIGEEVKTNRICLAPSIIQCLRALEIYKYFQEDTLDVKVYKIVVDENDEQLISWEQLYLNGLVDDAALTHEYWYKSKLIPVEYNEYRISECVKKRYIIISSKEKMRIKEIIETMGVCFNRLEKYNAFQIMNEWLPRQSETFQEQVKKKLTHKVEEYTEGSAEIYKKIFGNIPERFREEYIRASRYCTVLSQRLLAGGTVPLLLMWGSGSVRIVIPGERKRGVLVIIFSSSPRGVPRKKYLLIYVLSSQQALP